MVYKFLDKKSRDTTDHPGTGIVSKDQQLGSELQRFITRILKEHKIDPSFYANILRFDLSVIQSISKYKKGVRFLRCVNDFYCKYAWVVPLKDEKVTTITNAIQNLLDKCGCKPNKIWIDHDSDFYNTSLKL